MTEETFEPDNAEEIEAYYTLEAMREYYEIGKIEGRAERLCTEIDHEQKAREFKPTRSQKRIDELMASCPF